MASSKNATVVLESSDGAEFEVSAAAASMLRLVRTTTVGVDDTVHLPNVHSEILAKVLEYCENHAAALPEQMTLMEKWDKEFMEGVDMAMLALLLDAVQMLGVRGLLDLGCRTLAGRVGGKGAEEVRSMFGLKKKYFFSEKEMEEIRRGFQWAYLNNVL